jgi:hypothetical protein
MIRSLNRLKTALARAGITSCVNSTGTSRVSLQFAGAVNEVTCRTNASDGHRWWFWMKGEPIAAANDIDSAVTAVKGERAGQAVP